MLPAARRVGPAEFTRRLLEQAELASVALPLERRRVAGGAARVAWIAEALKRDALGWLCRQGGWRLRQVVLRGRRVEGRVWEERIFSRLGVRTTSN